MERLTRRTLLGTAAAGAAGATVAGAGGAPAPAEAAAARRRPPAKELVADVAVIGAGYAG
jgi:hypothetical protein